MAVPRIILERFAYSPDGTFGKLYIPSVGFECFTVELPWEDNEPRVSCIPEGVYTLGKRYSPVVQRSSGGEFKEGWEVQDVPGRTYIMIHPGNWPHNFKGCIGVGRDYMVIPDRTGTPRNGVSSSRLTFSKLMAVMDTSNGWELDIRQKVI